MRKDSFEFQYLFKLNFIGFKNQKIALQNNFQSCNLMYGWKNEKIIY